MALTIVSYFRATTAAGSSGSAGGGSARASFPWDDISQTADCPDDPRVVLLGFAIGRNVAVLNCFPCP